MKPSRVKMHCYVSKCTWARYWTSNCTQWLRHWWVNVCEWVPDEHVGRREEETEETLKRSHLPLVCECVCEWVNAGLCCKVLWVVEKTRKALYKYSPFTISACIAGSGCVSPLSLSASSWVTAGGFIGGHFLFCPISKYSLEVILFFDESDCDWLLPISM